LGTSGSPFLTTGTHILGFAFTNEATGMTNYGYLTMQNGSGPPSGFPSTVLSWSFNNQGNPITVVVPEPSSILLTTAAIAFGARGLRRWRRQDVAA
jgi:hypothetical protein